MISVKSLEGDYKGKVFQFNKKSILLGRGPDCDLRLDDPTCSRQHAGIELRNHQYLITDLKSANGVLVNGKQVFEAPLKFRDTIQLGNNLFLFLSDAAVETDEVDPNLDEMIDDTTTIMAVEEHLAEIGSSAASRSGVQEISADMLAKLQRANQQLHAVYQLSLAVNSSLELADLYQVLVDNIFSNFMNVERACIFLIDKETDSFARVKSQAKESTQDLPVSRAVLDRVKKDRTGILASDAMRDQRFETSHTVAALRLRSLMCVPLINRDRILGAIYVENCTRPDCFARSDLELLTVFGNQAAMAIESALLYDELEKSFYETIRSLSKAIEAKDKYTRGHSARVAHYAVEIGRSLGLSEEQIENLRLAAELHDIGKIGMPEELINREAKLTDAEYEMVKKHPVHGVEILRPIRFLKPVLPIVLHHHERYNGKGYPYGLVGEQIPLEARILNLADAFDAMTTKRPYNIPRSIEQALDECMKEAGVSFDRDCVEALVRIIRKKEEQKACSTTRPLEPVL